DFDEVDLGLHDLGILKNEAEQYTHRNGSYIRFEPGGCRRSAGRIRSLSCDLSTRVQATRTARVVQEISDGLADAVAAQIGRTDGLSDGRREREGSARHAAVHQREDSYAERRAKCGVPSELTFKTKIELGLD